MDDIKAAWADAICAVVWIERPQKNNVALYNNDAICAVMWIEEK